MFTATHMVPDGGLATYQAPGSAQPNPTRLDPRLEVEVAERYGDWARIVCSNTWSAWVDGRALIDIAGASEEANALLDELGGALRRYEQAVAEAAAGTIGEEEYRRRAFKAGLVVHDDDAWLFDLVNQHWCRYDGFGLRVLDLPHT